MSGLRATVLGVFAGCSLLLFGASFAFLISSIVRNASADLIRSVYGLGISTLQAAVLCTWLYVLYAWISIQAFPSKTYRMACGFNAVYCVILIGWTYHVVGGWPQNDGFNSMISFAVASIFVAIFIAYEKRGRRGEGDRSGTPNRVS